MDVRNRMADVVKLRCNACQDFLKLVIRPNWQQNLYNKAEKEVTNNTKYKDKYIAVYEKMRDIGIENYSVDDMDVTFISEMVYGCRNIVPTEKETKKAITQLKADRNLTNHSNENEDQEELYLRGLLALCNLRNFVRIVDKAETSIDDDTRIQYRRDYIAKIEDLKTLLDDERIELIKRDKDMRADIEKVLNANDGGRTWATVNNAYFDRCFKINKDAEAYKDFIFKAADAGIMEAYGSAADYYIDVKKYNEAEKLLYALYNSDDEKNHDPRNMMKLASIYLNQQSENAGDGKKILQELIERGYVIESEDEKSYMLISKAESTKGKPLFKINVAEDEK